MVSGRGISGCTQDLNQNRRPAVCVCRNRMDSLLAAKTSTSLLDSVFLSAFCSTDQVPHPERVQEYLFASDIKMCTQIQTRTHTDAETQSLCVSLSLSPGRRSLVGGRSCRSHSSGSNPLVRTNHQTLT